MHPADTMAQVADEMTSGDVPQEFFDLFYAADWLEYAGRAYPPNYAYAIGRFPAHPEANRRLREGLAGIPRVNPDDYEIILNIEGTEPDVPGPTWDVVKWVATPNESATLFGMIPFVTMILDPYPIYSFSALRRPSWGFTDMDLQKIRQNSLTLRGPRAIEKELRDRALRKKLSADRQRANDTEAMAGELRPLFRREAEEMGI